MPYIEGEPEIGDGYVDANMPERIHGEQTEDLTITDGEPRLDILFFVPRKLPDCETVGSMPAKAASLSADSNMRAEFCAATVENAAAAYLDFDGAVLHSDRGTNAAKQYLDEIMSQTENGYTIDEINRTCYHKKVSSGNEIFDHLSELIPDSKTAFLYNKRNHF